MCEGKDVSGLPFNTYTEAACITAENVDEYDGEKGEYTGFTKVQSVEWELGDR